MRGRGPPMPAAPGSCARRRRTAAPAFSARHCDRADARRTQRTRARHYRPLPGSRSAAAAACAALRFGSRSSPSSAAASADGSRRGTMTTPCASPSNSATSPTSVLTRGPMAMHPGRTTALPRGPSSSLRHRPPRASRRRLPPPEEVDLVGQSQFARLLLRARSARAVAADHEFASGSTATSLWNASMSTRVPSRTQHGHGRYERGVGADAEFAAEVATVYGLRMYGLGSTTIFSLGTPSRAIIRSRSRFERNERIGQTADDVSRR